MVRFDAYTATSAGLNYQAAIDLLASMERGDSVTEGRGFHTFGHRASVKDDAGDEVGSVSWGGSQLLTMIEVKGERTPAVVEKLREACEHRCTRVDSCADFDAPGAWDRLLDPVMEVKAKHRLYGEKRGDWDQPELGRSMYLGAPSSPIRARLYEKGKQPELRHLSRFDLVRLELQVRPQKDAKAQYARLSALDVWGASKWTRQLAAEVLEEHLDPHPPGTVRKLAERDHKLRWLCRQYGATLLSLKEDLGGWKEVGLTLRDTLAEVQREDERWRKAGLKGGPPGRSPLTD